MLAHLLAIVIGLGSFVLYMAAFFFPEVYRRYDFIWSGIGMFYALVLWFCAGRITGGVLIGQTASVALLGWFGWQTLKLRRDLTPLRQQTPLPQKSASFGQLLKNRVALVGTNALAWVQRRPSANKLQKPPVARAKSPTQTTQTRRAAAPVSPPAYEVLDEFEPPPARVEVKLDAAVTMPEVIVPQTVETDATPSIAPSVSDVEGLDAEVFDAEVFDADAPAPASLPVRSSEASTPKAAKAQPGQRRIAVQPPKKSASNQFTGLLTTARNRLQQSLRLLSLRKQGAYPTAEKAVESPGATPASKPETADVDWDADMEAWEEELTFEEIGEAALEPAPLAEEETLLLRREISKISIVAETRLEEAEEAEEAVVNFNPASPDPEDSDPEGSDPEGSDSESPDPEDSDLESPDPESSALESPDPESSDAASPDLESSALERSAPESSDTEIAPPEGINSEEPEAIAPDHAAPGEPEAPQQDEL